MLVKCTNCSKLGQPTKRERKLSHYVFCEEAQAMEETRTEVYGVGRGSLGLFSFLGREGEPHFGLS